ncbi:MAG: tryptophan-rich sensory protein [Eubacteriales bacterium]|jgi:succinate dehydrogenase hydrophobic anchor subunit|nr:tryptophan-rich sensory protein [Eubacteriales bacterium]MDD4105337.1 tryptophan-rich sensory protein [Eubacteriales bacterium]MDD4710650.1 tryptophan-rich sensory protein [Eubacteriales bacterium]NLO16403.1 tryptophan-rich sensory protein [Clostridiales bacterium]
MRTKTKAWLNLVLFLVTLAVNTLGALGFINGMSQKEISDTYPTLITPSASTFSIWGVIYVLLLIALVYMVVKHQEARTANLIDAISLPFWVSSAANILWITTFSYDWIGISTLLILLLVISLAVLNSRLKAPEGIGQRVNSLAFGLYNGWLIIATVVNVSAFLVQQQWNGFGLGADAWAVVILIVALILSSLILIKLRNAALTLPLAWAYYGIWQEHQAAGKFAGLYPAVATTALVIAILYVVIAGVVFIRNGKCLLPRTLAQMEGTKK